MYPMPEDCQCKQNMWHVLAKIIKCVVVDSNAYVNFNTNLFCIMHIKLYGPMFPYNKYINKQMHIIQYVTMIVMNCILLNAILS